MKDIELWYGDCLELMNNIPNESVDMILADLPYGRTRNHWDSIINLNCLWRQYERIIKKKGVIALFADGMFMAKLMISNEKFWRYNIVWDKKLSSGFLNANKMPLRQTEEIVIFYKNHGTYNPQKILGNKNHSQGKEKTNKNNNYGKRNFQDNAEKLGSMKHPTSLISISKTHPSKMIHPTEKPIELLEWLIKTYTNEFDLILDNVMGSGSTGVACKNLNRKFIGIEKDKKYFDIAVDRINNT